MSDIRRVRVRLVELGHSQEWLARQLEIDPSALSRYLRGLREAPADLSTRIEHVFSRELDAQRAAAAARDRVLGPPEAA